MKEFHIRLYEENGQYRAEPVVAEADTANPKDWPCPLELPAPLPSGRTLEDFQEALLDLEQGETANELQAMGNYLFHFLFGPDNSHNALYKTWLNSFQQGQQADGLRTVLHLESDKLAGLPWELISTDNGVFLAAMERDKPHTLARARWQADDFSPGPVDLPDITTHEPLRVLLAVCNNREDDERIMGPEEALRVDEALYLLLPWKVDLRVLVRPSFKETQDWLSEWQPHIFHYVGHGDFDGVNSYLKFYEPSQTDSIQIGPQTLANLFGNHPPRLVVLNACRSGQVGPGDNTAVQASSAQGTLNLSKVLIEGGVLAVIAMQADIEGQGASFLMDQFYRHLASGEVIDVALTSARRAFLKQVGLSTNKWDWALPALYFSEKVKAEDVLTLAPEDYEAHIFKVSENEPERYKRHIQDLQLRVKIQVGREREQMMLEHTFLRSSLEDIKPVTIVYGETEIGKTNLLYWLSEGLARRGRQFIYADFGQTALDYWDSLRLIRDGKLEAKVSGVKLYNQIDPELAFNTFNHALNAKLVKGYARKHPLAPDAVTPVSDMAMDKNPALELENLGTVRSNENPVETITEAFWTSLARIAEPGGLIVFLDHVDKMFAGEVNRLRTYLVNRVLNPADYPNARKVRLVLAVQSNPVEQANQDNPWSFLTQSSDARVDILNLQGLPPENLEWLARLWARRYFISYGPAFLKNKHVTPENIDAYVASLLNPFYQKRPQRPGRLVRDLLNSDRLEDWLNSLS
ncbi:MAG TPA: CHAT domain-containing protein [Chloroflexia bacterium]|nr:CHAT domain-containing protein [Chloroflexia bacterium]